VQEKDLADPGAVIEAWLDVAAVPLRSVVDAVGAAVEVGS